MKKKRQMTSYIATAIAEGWGEGETATDEERREAWQYLVDTGLAWKLQGNAGRMASELLKSGFIKFPKTQTHDLYGNPIPTRKSYEKLKRKLARKF